MSEEKLKLLRQMREIVKAKKASQSVEHPHQSGIELFRAKRFSEAAEKFREAIKFNSDFPFSHHYLGITLYELGEFDEALEALQKAAELNPHYAATFVYLGKIEFEKGNLSKAEKHYRESLKLRSGLPEAMMGLAAVLVELHEKNDSDLIELLGEIIKIDATNDVAISQLVSIHPVEAKFYIDLANDLLSSGQKSKAMLLYRFAVLANPKLPVAKLKLAEILYSMGESEASAEYLQDAKALSDQNAQTYQLIGDLLAKQNSHTEAIAAYRQSLKIDSNQAEIHKKIGDVLANQNQLKEAHIAYSQALELGYEVY